MTLADQGFLDVAPLRLEYRMIGPRPDAAPTIVMLHDGLGSVGPLGLVSRPNSPRRPAPACSSIRAPATANRARQNCRARPPSCTRRPARCCRACSTAIGFQRGILLGHSDGASIATIYAGSVQDHRVRGLVLMAPHFFTEEMGLAEIRRAREAFAAGALRDKLKRWHADVDCAFRSWSEPWLDPQFRKWDITEALGYIRVPILIVQGDRRPIRHAQAGRDGATRNASVRSRPRCCPASVTMPQREAPELTLEAVADFVNRLLRDHHEGGTAAGSGVAVS